jgi:toxin ParE1/3/4
MRRFRVHVKVEAAEDLIAIWRDIAVHNPVAATTHLYRLDDRIDSLFEMPNRGPRRDDLSPGLRMLVEKKHLIFYRVIEGEVFVERVLHGSRDLGQFFN